MCVLRSPFPCLASERLCVSLSASSRRCLLQELRSYIGSMLLFLLMLESAGAPTVRVRIPAYKRGRLQCRRHLLPTNSFGAAVWPQRTRTPRVRPQLRLTLGTPKTGHRCSEAGRQQLPKGSYRRLRDDDSEERKP